MEVKNIEIRGFFTDWHEVDEEKARKYVLGLMKMITALKKSEQIEFIETKRLRGITVEDLLSDKSQ